MLVSGGKILAIDQVYTDNRTISGDGVQKPLGVTDIIATTATVSSVSSKLEQQISAVSGKFDDYYPKSATSAAAEISAAFENFKTDQVIVSAGSPNVTVSAITSGDKTIIYSVNVAEGDVSIIGASGISAKLTNGVWELGLSANYLSANALDVLTAYYKKTETSAAEEISAALTALSSWADETFLKEHQSLSAYYKKTETSSRNEIDNALLLKQDVSAMSAYQKKGNYVTSASDELAGKQLVLKDNEWQELEETNWTSKIEEASAAAVTSAKNYVDDTLKDYYKTTETSSRKELEDEFVKYQLKGDYLSANALDNLSGKWNSAYDTVETNSGAWNAHSALSAAKFDASAATAFMLSAQLKSNDKNEITGYADSAFYVPEIPEYLGGEGIKIDDFVISISSDFLSANALDNLSGKWESVYDTTVTASGNWNEASAFSAASGKFVTSAGVDFNPDLAYFLKKQENDSVVWEGVDLSNLGKMYNISSLTPDLISAGISADAQNNPIYVLSAAKPGEVAAPGISGENGVSARYDDEANKYVVGLSGSPAYASFTATTTADDGVYTPATYSESYNVGNGVTLEDNTISVGPGLWHVTIYAKVTNTETSPNYYDTVLTCNSIKNIVQFDNSYIHTEYINLDADVVSNDSLAINIELEDVPANSTVVIEQLQLHRIVTGNVTHEGGNTYTPGDGISIDNYQVGFNAGDGLKVDSTTNNVDVQAGSGVFIDANNKLSIKLGKGLAFSADGDIVAIETNGDVNEVVETVQNLQKELDGKLTTNMNISDAKSVGNPWSGDNNVNNLAASLFTIPLQHNLTTASTISFITTHDLGQSDHAPLMLGILEYNFDYFVTANNELGVSSRSQTKWIADTGPIWADGDDCYDIYGKNPATGGAGRYTYRLKNLTNVISSYVEDNNGKKYYNEVGPCMRSDRAYYLALFAHDPNNYNWFLSDDGFNTNTINNTDPAISFRVVNCAYYEDDTSTAHVSIGDTFLNNVRNGTQQFSLSGLPWWNRAYNDIDKIQRPYVMIRNPRL